MVIRLSPRSRVLATALAAIAAGALAVPTGGCSFIVDGSAAQCQTDADCTSRGAAFVGYRCGAQKVCTADEQKFPCKTNAQCVPILGANSICTGRVKYCAKLTTPECPRLLGKVTSDNTVVLGALFSKLSEKESSQGSDSVDAIDIARGDFELKQLGVPSATGSVQREIVVVACDDDDETKRIVAANHLVKTLDVPAVIGAENSGNTIKVASAVTFPNGTLLFSPAASSDDITMLRSELPPPRLLWRTAPPDILQSAMVVDQITELETVLRAGANPPPAKQAKVAILFRKDNFGKAISDSVVAAAQINGAALTAVANEPYYRKFSYAFPIDPAELVTQRTQLQALQPDIVVILGNDEVAQSVISELDLALTKKPLYLLTDGSQNTDTQKLAAANGDLRRRIRVTGPGNHVPPDALAQFSGAFKERHNNQFSGSIALTGAYDAFYMIALGAAGAAKSGTGVLTGATIATTMARLVDPAGTETLIGPGTLVSMHTAIQQSGSKLRLRGTSGGLNINPLKGEGPGEIVVFCIATAAGGDLPKFTPTGRYLDVAATPAAPAGPRLPTICP
jgi:branched-chain amino acid transport system substrate-binding protein